jgi:cobaltochelatase CobT
MKLPSVEGHKKFLRSILEKADVDVHFVKNLDVPYAARDPRTGRAVLFLREPILTDLVEITLWDWDAHHEGSHLFPELGFTYESIPMLKSNAEKTVHNILSDNICERARHGMWRGRDRILYQGRKTFCDKHPDVLLKREHVGISALYQWDFADRLTWQGSYPVLVAPKGTDKYLRAFAKIDIGPRIVSIMESQSAEDFVVLIREIVKAIMDNQSQEEQQGEGEPQPQKGKGKKQKGDPSKEKSEGDGGSQGEQEGESEGEEGNEEGSGSGSEDSDGEDGSSGAGSEEDKESGDDPTSKGGADGDGEDSQGADNTEDSQGQSGDGGKSGEDDTGSEPDNNDGVYQGNTEGSGDTRDLSKVDVADNAREMHTTVTVDEEDLEAQSQWSAKYTPVGQHEIVKLSGVKGARIETIGGLLAGNTVSRQVQRYLKIMSKDNYQYGMVNGRIHGKNVHRIYNGEDNPRIFKQKVQHRLKTDTAVEIMLDCSGSMSTHKYCVGAACCMAISKTLWELRIPHEILGFTEDYGSLITYPFKLFPERVLLPELLKRFASSIDQGYNADGESILIGANRLSERKEPNKLMIVLSDGRPATSGYSGDGRWYLKQVVKRIEESNINIIGIGVQDNSVRQFYSHWRVVSHVEDLNSVLFELLKESLT